MKPFNDQNHHIHYHNNNTKSNNNNINNNNNNQHTIHSNIHNSLWSTQGQIGENMSNRPLTKVYISLLARGPNFAFVTWCSPRGEYVAAIEKIYLNLTLQRVQELRVETKRVSKLCAPIPNIDKDEAKSFKELRWDKDRLIFTIDKGVAMVVLDRQDNIRKVMDLLVDRNTYRPLTADLHQQT